MARITIRTLDDVVIAADSRPELEARHYFSGPGEPLQLCWNRLDAGVALTLPGTSAACLVYVLGGSVSAGGRALAEGSSAIVEQGACESFVAGEQGAVLLVFRASQCPAGVRGGGSVHLLPTERVPRTDSFHGTEGVAGGLHADASCSGCQLWLHEQAYRDADRETALHSHSEDEIIFITGGQIRFGRDRYGPGTAIAIAANARYAFFSGEGGLRFINFRAASPTYRSADGKTVLDEAELWRSALGTPHYLAPVS
ncbi:hypothetical protein [Haliea sp. E17]|uniref:hypothetical protein n=1 Tax=Haliea sp. E17 TaxID=3401576 RepID=UPI003AAF43BA